MREIYKILKNEKYQIIKLFLGFFLCSLSIVFEIHSNIGASPWSIFHQGLAKLTGISLGRVTIIGSILIVIFVNLLGLKVGIGTFLNMFFVGWFVDMIDNFNLMVNASAISQGYMMIFLSMLFYAIGSYLYISCEWGCGPRDGLMSALAQKTHLPVGYIRFLIEAVVFILGWGMGGDIGVGSVLYVIGIGFIVSLYYKIVNFDITSVKHKNITIGIFRNKE